MQILIIFLLLVVNGLFSMAEIAVVSARKARLQQRADQGDRKAAAALKLAEAPDEFLSTVQIGITLIGILAGAFGGATLSDPLAARLASIPALAPTRMGWPWRLWLPPSHSSHWSSANLCRSGGPECT